MLIKVITFYLLFYASAAISHAVQVDMRHRPPEMSIVNGKYYGPIIDVIESLLSDEKVELQWVNVPWPRTLLRAQNGRVDLIPRHSMTSDREKYLLPMLLGYEQRHVRYLFGPHIKNVSKYQTLKQLKKLKFGLLRGSYYGPFIENIDAKKSTIFTNDIEQLMSILLAGRIDVMPIQNLTWAENAFQNVKPSFHGLNYQLANFKESFFSGKYISIPKLSPLTAKYHQLNCKLFQLRKSGMIDTIYQQYSIPAYIQIFDNKESERQEASCVNKAH